MKYAIEYLIDDVVEIANAASKSDDLKRQAYGMDDLGLDPSSDDGLAYVLDPNPYARILKALLNSLSLETLQRLQALMYSGRDKESALKTKKHLAERSSATKELVRTISEKRMNLEVYFREALQQAKKENLNLDTF